MKLMEKLHAQVLSEKITIWKVIAFLLGFFLTSIIGIQMAAMLPIIAFIAVCFPVPLSKIFRQASAVYFVIPPIEVIFLGGWVLFGAVLIKLFIK